MIFMNYNKSDYSAENDEMWVKIIISHFQDIRQH